MDPRRYNRLIFVRRTGFTLSVAMSLRKITQRFVSLFESLRFWVCTLYEALGLLVQIGFDIAAFTPSAYQRGSLPRPSMEISS